MECPRGGGGGGACECPRGGCFSIFRRADDITPTMSKKEGCLSIFQRADDVMQAVSKRGCLSILWGMDDVCLFVCLEEAHKNSVCLFNYL